MEIRNIDEFVKGWFIGDFEPAALKTNKFEVALQTHVAGEDHDVHYHRESREYNLLISGSMMINKITFHPGDLFIIEPYEVSEPTFLTDVVLVVVRDKSVKGDKVVVENP